jgi:hypothetical protein
LVNIGAPSNITQGQDILYFNTTAQEGDVIALYFLKSIPLTPFLYERKGEKKREGLAPLSAGYSPGVIDVSLCKRACPEAVGN